MAKTAKEHLSFEEAIERLEHIVAQMEAAELPLDQIIEKYEEGMKLLSFCEGKLTAAEKKIELLTQTQSGKIQRAELGGGNESAEPVAESGRRKGEKTPQDDTEVSLF